MILFKLSLVVLNNEYFIIKVNLICGFWFTLMNYQNGSQLGAFADCLTRDSCGHATFRAFLDILSLPHNFQYIHKLKGEGNTEVEVLC